MEQENEIDIFDLKISFPFAPYKQQVTYMESVARALNYSSNALLESPTGTGKTICLLSVVVAWQKRYVETMCANRNTSNLMPDEMMMEMLPVKVVYCSRTHSQLQQVVEQFKKTKYAQTTRVVHLASRDHLCVEESVQKPKFSNSMKQARCNQKVKSHTCKHYNAYQSQQRAKDLDASSSSSSVAISNIADIEELHNYERHTSICPYFKAKSLASSAEIIFMPYNYIFDPNLRHRLSLDLSRSIIIVDEGHNVDQVCEESNSCSITSKDIALAISECDKLVDLLNATKAISIESAEPLAEEANPDNDVTIEDVALVKRSLLHAESYICCIVREHKIDQSPSKGVSLSGGKAIEFLDPALELHHFSQYVEVLQKCSERGSGSASYLFNQSVDISNTGLGKFSRIMATILSPVLDDSVPNLSSLRELCDRYFTTYIERDKRNEEIFTFNYWCLSASFTLNLLKKGLKYHSLLITSGTLGNLTLLEKEFEVQFDIKLRNDHVIDRSQVNVCALRKVAADSRNSLDFRYNNRSLPVQIDDVGRSILHISGATPNGMIVFFQSYLLMGQYLDAWESNGLMSQIKAFKKSYVEQKGGNVLETIAQFKAEAEGSYRGAILFAVCRGTISEGIDFADHHARAVVLLGLPYMPRFDPRVTAKITYLDSLKSGERKLISGNEWYEEQTWKAISQCIGRVIRHSKDWGSIFLIDQRFGDARFKERLPQWLPNCKMFDCVRAMCKTSFLFVRRQLGIATPWIQLNSKTTVDYLKSLEEDGAPPLFTDRTVTRSSKSVRIHYNQNSSQLEDLSNHYKTTDSRVAKQSSATFASLYGDENTAKSTRKRPHQPVKVDDGVKKNNPFFKTSAKPEQQNSPQPTDSSYFIKYSEFLKKQGGCAVSTDLLSYIRHVIPNKTDLKICLDAYVLYLKSKDLNRFIDQCQVNSVLFYFLVDPGDRVALIVACHRNFKLSANLRMQQNALMRMHHNMLPELKWFRVIYYSISMPLTGTVNTIFSEAKEFLCGACGSFINNEFTIEYR